MHRAYQASAPSFPTTIWVSPSGSDTVGLGTQSSPLRQFTAAVSLIRLGRFWHPELANATFTINMRSGTYAVGALTTADSNLSVSSYDGVGLAVIDAGYTVPSWTNVSGSLYKASVPNTCWTVYENGVRSNMCRLPKRIVDSSYPLSRQPYFSTASDSNSLTRLKYNPVDFDPSTWTASDLSYSGYMGGPWQWFGDTGPVSSIDTTNKFLNMTNEMKFNAYQFGTSSRYYVQGIKAMCTDPGEFYLDRGAGELYYIARDGAIGSQSIVIPTAAEALTITGNSWTDRVTNVTFDGVAFQNTDHVQWYRPGWSVPSPGIVNGPVPPPPVAPVSAWIAVMPEFKVGAVHLRNVDNITLRNCHVKNAGMYGVFLDEYASNCTISGTWAERCGLAGIRLDGQFASLGDIVRDNTLDNFKITNTGELSSQTGLQIWQSGNNTVSHFEISDGPRQGIWITGPIPATYDQVYCRNNAISYGKLHHLCQDSVDVGALGFDSFSNVAQNTARQLIISNVTASPYASGLGPVGVFCDDQTGADAATGQVLTDIRANQSMAGNGFRANNSTGHTLTNCSFLSDGSANPSFDVSKIDTANIGVTGSFPY